MNSLIKLISLAVSLLFLISCNNPKNDSPNVLLLGTVHNPTKNVTADSIYDILQKFKPDIILMELDSTFFYEDFTYKFLFNGNEMVATTRYKMQHPEVQLRPIEFEGRETYRDQIGIYPEITLEFGSILQQLSQTNRLNNNEKEYLRELFYYDSLNTRLKEEKLSVINDPKTDLIVDSLNHYKYLKLKQVSDNHVIFKTTKLLDAKKDSVSVKENFDLYVDFEMNQRNNALANNSIAIIKQNPNKKIIILVGFAHKSFILKAFKKQGILCKSAP